jgi:hypothetical protein
LTRAIKLLEEELGGILFHRERANMPRDNQDENSATIRMRIWRRCRAVGRA